MALRALPQEIHMQRSVRSQQRAVDEAVLRTHGQGQRILLVDGMRLEDSAFLPGDPIVRDRFTALAAIGPAQDDARRQILYRLKDAYHAVGNSSGTTFHEFKYPLRLDYIFHSDEIVPVKIEIKRGQKLSDHYPVVGYFKLP